jgi:signal transduction histidine kinase
VTDSGAGISQSDQQKLFKGVVQFNPDKLQEGGGSGFGTCTGELP